MEYKLTEEGMRKQKEWYGRIMIEVPIAFVVITFSSILIMYLMLRGRIIDAQLHSKIIFIAWVMLFDAISLGALLAFIYRRGCSNLDKICIITEEQGFKYFSHAGRTMEFKYADVRRMEIVRSGVEVNRIYVIFNKGSLPYLNLFIFTDMGLLVNELTHGIKSQGKGCVIEK